MIKLIKEERIQISEDMESVYKYDDNGKLIEHSLEFINQSKTKLYS